MRALKHEYRLVWRRVGDTSNRTRIFATPLPLYRLLLRLGTNAPWEGATPGSLKGITCALARALGVPTKTLINRPIRQVYTDLSQTHRPLQFLRVEARQVLPWHEVGDPLTMMRPKNFDARLKMLDKHIDNLDQHPEKRWVPLTEELYEQYPHLNGRFASRGKVHVVAPAGAPSRQP